MDAVNRKVTYRLYPTARQEWRLLEMLVLHQRLYNAALEQRIKVWRGWQKSLSFADQCKDLTELRAESAEYRQINAQSEQVTLRRVDLAFRNFFRRLKNREEKAGFPRFKSVERFSGFGYKEHGDGWALQAGEGGKHGKLRLSGVGLIKMRGKARVNGEVKTLEITRKAGNWYASVTISCKPERASGEKKAGIDWGVKTFATIAYEDGAVKPIENPRHLRTKLPSLKQAQKELSRKQKGSQNRKRAVKILSKIHGKIARERHDFLHKTTAAIVKEVQLIAVEKLDVKSMTASGGSKCKKGLNREILSTSPAQFMAILKYKAEEAGIQWHEVPTRQVKPTQTCSVCFKQAKKSLSERMHECECGAKLDRDENAAKVILIWGLRQRTSGREPTMCGAQAMAWAAKHETPAIPVQLVGWQYGLSPV
jgi:putative transposase